MMDYTVADIKAINEKANELLLKHDDRSKNPAIDPLVNIEKIAHACGVKKIEYVSPDILNGKHAIYKDGVIMIDEADVHGQRRFDIAHEIGHIVFEYLKNDTINIVKDYRIVRRNDGRMYIKPVLEKAVSQKAARQKESRKSELSPGEQKIEVFLDRFAANLLVPINSFQLWEDRGDQEIADAFHVEKKCIIKRREEIKHELKILTSEMKPCSELEVVDPDVKLDVYSFLEESAIIDAN
jgi:Zn-dependent peptidase ImmA (M78 family)